MVILVLLYVVQPEKGSECHRIRHLRCRAYPEMILSLFGSDRVWEGCEKGVEGCVQGTSSENGVIIDKLDNACAVTLFIQSDYAIRALNQ